MAITFYSRCIITLGKIYIYETAGHVLVTFAIDQKPGSYVMQLTSLYIVAHGSAEGGEPNSFIRHSY